MPLLDTLLPPDCYLCGMPAGNGKGGAPICANCAGELPRNGSLVCPRCALPTPEGQICGRCLREPPAFDATHALYRYVFPVDVLVHAFKYNHRLSLTRFFTDAAANIFLPEADVLVPMPLHPKRLAERGFNQALEIARPLARAANLPLARESVVRKHYAPPQVTLAREARLTNPRGTFACRRQFDGLRVMVVDDVMTTGASLNAIARCLKAAGASAVCNFVIARAG